ncbi:MAG: hypothetical protein QGF74_02715 [Candidatus Nanoarchaeia archaeon]|jgi:hypothetical protein|nr:hypothetical protein [Candidatus Nanoarchaeia archaeon]|tara:strand:+ start:12894 stop:13181 length:288 start_codon:yes stop_codon:yes gene_type:complete
MEEEEFIEETVENEDKELRDVYSEEGREESIEDDEIDEVEQGFMQGYDAGDRLAKCSLCLKILSDDFIEEELKGELYRFCSEEHAETYKRKLEKK